MTTEQEALLYLARLGTGRGSGSSVNLDEIDWRSLIFLSHVQGVLSVVYDGLQSLYDSHHHHSVFQFEGCMVENHYDFVNVHSHSSNKHIETLFKELAEDRSRAVEQLGFDQIVFHTPDEYRDFASKNRSLVDKVLGDILCPKSFNGKGKSFFPYVWVRFRCWWHNRWKHKIVYSDSLISTFFVQIVSHLMKPSSLRG